LKQDILSTAIYSAHTEDFCRLRSTYSKSAHYKVQALHNLLIF